MTARALKPYEHVADGILAMIATAYGWRVIRVREQGNHIEILVEVDADLDKRLWVTVMPA